MKTKTEYSYKTTTKEQIHVYEIAVKMMNSDVRDLFVSETVKKAVEYQGLYNLMCLWEEAETDQDKTDILCDIANEIKWGSLYNFEGS